MLKYRLITGPILVVVMLGLIAADEALANSGTAPPGIVIFGLGLFIAPFAAWELAAMGRANGVRSAGWLMTAAAITGLSLSYLIPTETSSTTTTAIIATGLAGAFAVSLLVYSRGQRVDGVFAAAGGTLVAMVYLGFLTGFLLALRREHSAWWIVGVILTTKTCDSGAYFTGRSIGRHKMIPWLSPGKTWEGLAGGALSAIGVGMLLAWASQAWLGPADHVSVGWGAVCGVVFAVVGQLGDLTMSLFKRGGGVKDSSTILPGLGGVLDVLDSPLLVAPVAYWMLTQAPF